MNLGKNVLQMIVRIMVAFAFLGFIGKAEKVFATHLDDPCSNVQTDYGHELGDSFNGVYAYSNGSCTGGGSGAYQCVEFVDRYFGRSDWTGNGGSYFGTASDKGLIAFENGSRIPPQSEDIIGYSGGLYGHVSIVSEVEKTDNSTYRVHVIEQNFSSAGARAILSMTRSSDGLYTIASRGSYAIQGWLRYPKKFIDKRASTPHAGKNITTVLGDPDGSNQWYYPAANPITNEIDASGDDKGMSLNTYVQNYPGKSCTINGTAQFCDGVIVYDALGGARSAYLVWYQQFGGYSGNGGWYKSGGPHSTVLRNPVTNSYWSQKDNCWRQDFQMGWLCYETIRSYDPGDVAPGVYDPWCKIFSDCKRWDQITSYAIAETYERNGAAVNLGSVFDDGGSVFVHNWTINSSTVLIQNFSGGNYGPSAIIYNPKDGNAYNVRTGFWEYYKNNNGPSLLGPPKEDEHGNSAAQPCAYISCQKFEKGELWWNGNAIVAYVPSVYNIGGSDIPPPPVAPAAPSNLKIQ